MELKTVAEMKQYINQKFTSPKYTCTSQPVSQARKNPAYTVFEIKFADPDGTLRPEFTGQIRCYKNGVTSSHE